jgi:uncharacterized membrane protein YgcG
MLRPARAVAAVVLAVLAGGFVLPGPVRADGPMRLDGQVTDEVGALDGREAEVRAALDRLRADGGLQLFVVYVRSFDGTPAQEWADQTATRSDFGRRDAVLAVATHDRSYAYAFDTEFPLTDTQLDVVATVAIEPALSANDWAGAAIAGADGYRAVLAGQPVPSPRIRPGEADPGGGGGGAGTWIAGAACLLLVAGGVVLVLWLLRRRRPRPAAAPAGPSTAELTARANDLLVELDNDLRASEQELALATGRYGAEATASYTAALESARLDVAEAFRLRMTLDETPGPDEAARRSTLEEIIRRCTAADGRLDAESEAFDALRDLEAKVEAEAAEVTERRAAIEARIPAATEALDAVRGRYVGPVATAIAGNVDQARQRLEFAGSVTAQATEAVAAGDRPRAALGVRAAEDALGQAETLLDAVERARTDLDAARAAIDTLAAEVESDLAAARAAQPGTPALVAAITGAVQALAAAREAVASPTTDPLAVTARLEGADAALDGALAEVRDAAERAARARAMLDHALVTARAEVAAAGDFIATRRGAVASQPRAWLAQAQQHLARAEALAASDPTAALSEAQRAAQLAAEAGRAAQSNVDQWTPPGIGGTGRGGGTDVLLGVLLGGILSGGGGGGRSRGWGGGGFRGGGFGGSGSRSRRTGGGRF